MRTFEYTITDEVGIHARPAGLLVKEAKNCYSVIKVTKDGKSAEAKKLMALMGLGVKKGDIVKLLYNNITTSSHIFRFVYAEGAE